MLPAERGTGRWFSPLIFWFLLQNFLQRNYPICALFFRRNAARAGDLYTYIYRERERYRFWKKLRSFSENIYIQIYIHTYIYRIWAKLRSFGENFGCLKRHDESALEAWRNTFESKTRILTGSQVCWRMLTCADEYWRMLTYADVCWVTGPTPFDVGYSGHWQTHRPKVLLISLGFRV